MPVIRIRPEDKERIEQMKGYLSVSAFITQTLDNLEKRPNKKQVHPYFNEWKKIYCNWWEKHNGFEYRWNGAIDATALNRLIKSFEAMNLANDKTGMFEALMTNLPKFYWDKTINAINKNLNGIIAEIKNGGNKSSKVQNGGIFDHR